MNKYHSITLRRSAGFVNGEKTFAEYPVQVMMVSENTNTGGNGRLQFLLAPGQPEVSPGDRIIRDEKEHEITEVVICRDIAGNIRAVKCTTLN